MLDLKYLDVRLTPCRTNYGHLFALLMSEQRRTYRRFVLDLASSSIAFRTADDGEHALFASHVHGDRRADVDL